MKFYYEGKLIRTSKNHIYTHAVIDITDNGLVGCRANKENAEAIISTEISQARRSIANCESAIKALESGKNGYYVKEGRRTWYYKFTPSNTVEKFASSIEHLNNYINRIESTWRVVELEARA